MNFTRVIFRPLKHLKLIGSWFPKGSAKFFSVLLRRNSTVAITIFCIVCFEAVARGLDDVLNNRPRCADFPGIILPFGFKPLKISHVKFTYPGQRPKPITSDLKQQRRRRLRKRHLKSGFSLLQTVSRLFHLVQFVYCWQTILELNSKRLYQGSRKIKSFVLVHVLHKTRSFKIWHFRIVVVQ